METTKPMNTIELLFATPDAHANEILRGVIGVWQAAFPQRVCGYFLTGSYADGTPTPTSDLDLAILFRDDFRNEEEAERAQAVCSSLELLRPAIFVDMWYSSEVRLQAHDRVSLALQLKYSSRLLFGAGTAALEQVEPNERYIRDVMHIPYYVSKYGRPHLQKLTIPLGYPEPAKPYFGYENWTISERDGEGTPSTKLLTVLVGRIATALVVLRTGIYIGSKAASTTKYQATLGDEWSDLVRDVYTLCKQQWHYRLPNAAPDQQRLIDLCQRALLFENHFYTVYHDYLVQELSGAAEEGRLYALERCAEVIYPDDAIPRTLQQISDGITPETRQQIENVLRQLESKTDQ